MGGSVSSPNRTCMDTPPVMDPVNQMHPSTNFDGKFLE